MGSICSLWCIISEIWDFLYPILVVKNCLSPRFLIGGAVTRFWTYDLFVCFFTHEIDYICIFFGSRSYQKTKMKYRPSVTHPISTFLHITYMSSSVFEGYLFYSLSIYWIKLLLLKSFNLNNVCNLYAET